MQQEEEHGNNGHEAQAADLDQAENYHLTKAAPLGIGVRQDKSCDASRGRGREKCCQEAAAFSAAGRKRQHQEKCSNKNHQGKGADQILLCTDLAGPPIPLEHIGCNPFFQRYTLRLRNSIPLFRPLQ